MRTFHQPLKNVNPIIRDSHAFSQPVSTELSGLWEKFLAGESSALTTLYRLQVRELYNYGRQFAEHYVVQDCIQDVFYDLIRKRETLKSVRTVKGYLFACLRHRVLKQLKKTQNSESADLIRLRGDFGVDLDGAALENCESFDQETLDKLKTACNKLTSRQREAVLLFYYEKLSYKDLSNVMQLGKITSARMLMHRAIQSLRKILGS